MVDFTAGMEKVIEGIGIDKTIKSLLLVDFKPNTFLTSPLFRFKVAGLWIQINYQGEEASKTLDFLKKYFVHFEQNSSFADKVDFVIHYRQPTNEYGSSSWKYWNEWTHEIDFLNQDNGEFDQMIARDFVGYITKDASEILAIGPELSFDTCDSIDNIISYMIGRHLLKNDGVILHAACTVFSGLAYVFFGASGAGKSTIAEFSQRKYGHGVISSDQVIIRYIDNKLFAELMPTTIPEFSLLHPARIITPIPVRAIYHLFQSNEVFSCYEVESSLWLKYFMRELVYRNEFRNEKKLLDLSLKIAQDTTVVRGEMSYQKETDYFSKLHEVLRIKELSNE